MEEIRLRRGEKLSATKKEIIARLIEIGIEESEARTEADMMVEHVAGMLPSQQLVCNDIPLTDAQVEKLDRILRKRAQRVPIQYLLEETCFMGLKFKIKPGVFIPRPDTETLVEVSLRKLKEMFSSDENLSILEIGVGSGAIAVSLLKDMGLLDVTGVDVSRTAIETTSENAAFHGVCDRLTLLKKAQWWQVGKRRFHALISNPPYIPKSQAEGLQPEVGWHEPEEALFGTDEDGLGFYREIAKRAQELLELQRALIAVEVGDGQAEPVRDLFQNSGFTEVEIHFDLNKLGRVVTAKLAPPLS